MKQLNIFDVATQEDRLEAAHQLMSAVFKEDIKWSAVQAAVNCQVAANRLVWKVNDTYFDTPEWDPYEREIPLMLWIPCKERLPDKKGWYIVTEWDYQHQCWDTSISEFHASGRWGYGNDKVIAWMPMPGIYEETLHEQSDDT